MGDVVLGSVPSLHSDRDAIHVAVIPMEAFESLRPGQRVGIVTPGVAGPAKNTVGIVDPFLQGTVEKGGRFWLALLPGTVTGMRHEWSHPSFLQTPSVNADSERLFAESVAAQCGKSLAALMEDAEQFVKYGEYEYDNSERYKNVDDWERFWRYFTSVTGIETDKDWAPYTCSC